MKNTLNFIETKDKLSIEILPKLKPIIKIGYVVMIIAYLFLIVAGCVVVFKIFDFNHLTFTLIGTIGCLILCVLMFYAIKSTLNGLYSKEIIEVTKSQISIIKKETFKTTYQTFPLQKISKLNNNQDFLESLHPLKGNNTDYTGFSAREKEAEFLIKEEKLGLFYNGSMRRFGNDLSSWDEEEILNRIESFTELKINSN